MSDSASHRFLKSQSTKHLSFGLGYPWLNWWSLSLSLSLFSPRSRVSRPGDWSRFGHVRRGTRPEIDNHQQERERK